MLIIYEIHMFGHRWITCCTYYMVQTMKKIKFC